MNMQCDQTEEYKGYKNDYYTATYHVTSRGLPLVRFQCCDRSLTVERRMSIEDLHKNCQVLLAFHTNGDICVFASGVYSDCQAILGI